MIRQRARVAAIAITAPSCASPVVRSPEEPDIRADRILADVAFVACDDRGGRDTPSAGQRLAARFIANRLHRLGWRPGAKDGWFHTHELVHRALDESACRATAARGDEKLELTFARDYSFLPQQIADLDLKAGVVHLGKLPDALPDPAPPDVKGKWVLITKPGGNLQRVEGEVRAAGAAGVLATVRVIGNLGGDPTGEVVSKLFADRMARIGGEEFQLPTYALARLAEIAVQHVLSHRESVVKHRRPGAVGPTGVEELELAARLFELQAKAERRISEIPSLTGQARARAADGSKVLFRIRISD